VAQRSTGDAQVFPTPDPGRISSLKVALFVPCYVDQFAPNAGMATVELLRECGIDFVFPSEQTCCGQAFLTAGARSEAVRLAERYMRVFSDYDAIVTPSGSCAATMRKQLPELVPSPEADRIAQATHELCAFLTEVRGIPALPGRLPARVGLHASCHGLRELRHGPATERRDAPQPDPARQLLAGIEGVELVSLTRPDECCGFGGLFAVEEEAVSVRMGLDRLADHAAGGAEVITSTDVSCLLHLGGLARRGAANVRALHIAELLMERIR
jgi:L-lactate dehydrogenase complex protein LldE